MYAAKHAYVILSPKIFTPEIANFLVETAVIENAPRIRVNAVMPGLVATSIFPMDTETWDNVGKSGQPLWGRAGRPVEVASLVAFLIGDEASLISGTRIRADGLWSLSGIAAAPFPFGRRRQLLTTPMTTQYSSFLPLVLWVL